LPGGDACQGGITWDHLQVNLAQQLNGIIIFMCSFMSNVYILICQTVNSVE